MPVAPLTGDISAGPIHDAAPVDVYLLEYPGYGARGGLSDRQTFFAAGEEAFGLMSNGLPKYLVSESIGAGVACHLAGAHPGEVAGLTLFAPYHDLASVAQRQMPFLPAYLLLLDRFNPAADLRNYHGPVKMVIAGADEIISPVLGRKLFAAYNGPKDLQVISGAHHNDIAAQPPDWWRQVFLFWQHNGQAKREMAQ